MIQDTSTMVASLKALKNRMSSSPSSPSFLSATPNTMANNTRPRMFMPSVSVPIGTYKNHTDSKSSHSSTSFIPWGVGEDCPAYDRHIPWADAKIRSPKCSLILVGLIPQGALPQYQAGWWG
ncbi:hypothetical protein EYF80_024352 [Liparis tanakae]|uniref:Uncharacterized protein n=1 Tax=Liparis tanakae TaxID=230148 RepID=A0A4Z2HKQ3_9TELE|nr:hypothetical protein EYF80_024352 [Liparis tanakae]